MIDKTRGILALSAPLYTHPSSRSMIDRVSFGDPHLPSPPPFPEWLRYSSQYPISTRRGNGARNSSRKFYYRAAYRRVLAESTMDNIGAALARARACGPRTTIGDVTISCFRLTRHPAARSRQDGVGPPPPPLAAPLSRAPAYAFRRFTVAKSGRRGGSVAATKKKKRLVATRRLRRASVSAVLSLDICALHFQH